MDAELNATEAELQAEEATLQSELSQLATVSRELADRMIALRVSASRAGEQGIAQRAQATPPVIDAEGGFRKARVAREAAVKARREANTTVRTLANAAKAQLQKLAAQVLADERALADAEEAAATASTAATQIQPAVDIAAPAPPSVSAAPTPKMAPKAEVPSNLPPKKHRTTNRVKMQAAVDFSSDDNFFNGFSANISDGGLFVATVNVLPLGTEVDLSFSLPSGHRIEAKGVVRWVREVNDKLPDAFPGMGVQFASLSNSAQVAIDQFMAQRDPLFFAEAE